MRSDISGGEKLSGVYRAFFALLMLSPLMLIEFNLDNDAWFLLNTGRFILENGFPSIEPFTLHENMAFMVPQWLSAVVFRYVYVLAGVVGLAVFRGLVFCVSAYVIFSLCRLVSSGRYLVSLGVSLFSLVLLALFYVTRPQIFSALIFLLELYVLEYYFIRKKAACLAALPFLSLALINLHASMWLMFFVLALPYAVDCFAFKIGFVKGTGAKKLPLVISLAASFAAGFANPYGLSAMTYLFRSYGHSEISNFIIEMVPPSINDTTGKVIFAVLAVVALTYILYRSGTSTVRYALLTLGTTVLTLSSTRSFLIFIVAAIFPLAYYLKDVGSTNAEREEKSAKPVMRRALFAALTCALAVAIAVSVSQTDFNNSVPDIAPAVEYIKSTSGTDKVRLYADYADGAYTEYEGLKTYIDPRAEVFVIENNKKDDIMAEYVKLQQGRLYYKDFLDKYYFTHLLVRSGDILEMNLSRDEGYKVVYEDSACKVYCPLIQK